jgi:Ca-activated chloride channel family protein
MMPVSKNYPKDFLRLKTNDVTVYFNGLVAETVVYQEFVNEWTDSTDVVYSFPLPANARATNIIYWHNDTAYKAILKVREQSLNPGTGDGGVAALVNAYIGTNGIKFTLNGIKPGEIQRVELHYLSTCDYYKGRCSYTFPLNTSQFITYPIDLQRYTFKVRTNTPITNWQLSSFPAPQVIEAGNGYLNAVLPLSKSYLDQDIQFFYETAINKFSVDFFAEPNDSTDGHFALFVRPQDVVVQDSIIKKCEIFILSNGSSMSGVKFDAAVRSISTALDLLRPTDKFNIETSGSYTNQWGTTPVLATADNIAAAKTFLASQSAYGGSDLYSAVLTALAQTNDTAYSNSILIFTDGGANLDPNAIESYNTGNCGIFPIGIGDNVNRARLEMTAALNYGFVTYIALTDNLYEKMTRVVNQINLPILKKVAFEYASDKISQVLPGKLQSTYAGSSFFITGRFSTKGIAPISIAGYSVSGFSAYDFLLNFGDSANYKQFTESLWAKTMIDAIEQQIEIYGETDALKQQDISLSLSYGIRCKYTAYIADYKTVAPTTNVKDKLPSVLPKSYLMGNYPNPFNPSTKIRFYIAEGSLGKPMFVKIFNMKGQLVAIIDISAMHAGWNEVTFNGLDLNGNRLASGIYLVRMQIGDQVTSTIKIALMK